MKYKNFKLITNTNPESLRRIYERKLKVILRDIDNYLIDSAEEAKRLEEVRTEIIRERSRIKLLPIRHQDEGRLQTLTVNEKYLDEQRTECIDEETKYLQAKPLVEMVLRNLQKGEEVSNEAIQELNQLLSRLNPSLTVTL